MITSFVLNISVHIHADKCADLFASFTNTSNWNLHSVPLYKWQILHLSYWTAGQFPIYIHHPIPQKSPTCCFVADSALPAFLLSPPVLWKGWWLPLLGKSRYVKPKKANLLQQTAISGKQQKQFLEVYLRHTSGIARSFLSVFLTVKNTHTCNYIFLDCIAKFMHSFNSYMQ